MSDETLLSKKVSRRTMIKAAAAASALQLTGPFIISARGEQPIKMGYDDPLTGTYAAVGKNEQIGAMLAVEQINKKGGILGRPVEMISEDSTSGDAGTAVQKARKLIDRDGCDFLLGNVNSALTLAMADVAAEKKKILMVTGGHTDAVTGSKCHYNVFRICNTTQMEANAVAPALVKNAGKKWYYITPDYAFGHTLQGGLERAGAKLGVTKVGGDLTPLGTTDFSSYLIKAQAANPDVIVILVQGDDMINCLKQAVQFGLEKKVHLAGAQQELEPLMGLPPEARIGTWVFEWYWNQPNVPHVNEFNAAIKAKTGHMPTARTWFGFAAAHACALGANGAKSVDAVKIAKVLQGFKLPPEVALMPGVPYFRAGQNQLIPNQYVGHAQGKGPGGPEDLFHVDEVVKVGVAAGTLEESECKMEWPS
ncbi:MAG TPA: ABC transporter substrate-binding protein [Usitatibacter sp.]|jgi:branched-chain amino acid transport system substrate-binding protein|nr:ABC transporter substrate-binding protein [Usitatibacter sp.]